MTNEDKREELERLERRLAGDARPWVFVGAVLEGCPGADPHAERNTRALLERRAAGLRISLGLPPKNTTFSD